MAHITGASNSRAPERVRFAAQIAERVRFAVVSDLHLQRNALVSSEVSAREEFCKRIINDGYYLYLHLPL
jgi:hypothetical protein